MAGRPLKFKSVAELKAKIDEYFLWAEANNKPLTIERLACFLECDRVSLLNYAEKDEYFSTIKQAKQIIYASKAEILNTKEGNTAGIIFDLCNNGDGYSNKSNESSTQTIIINDKSKEV